MKWHKPLIRKATVYFFLVCVIASTSCEKETAPLQLPAIDSSEIFTISSDAVSVKSTLDITPEDSVNIMGLCWSLQPDASIHNNFTSGYMIDSIMFARTEALMPDTKYYARVYIGNPERESYGNEIEFTTNSTVTDGEGNLYNVVTIGSQNWMAENFRATKYNDGSVIQSVGSDTDWSEFDSPGYAWYDYNLENKHLYGALYNWPVVNSGDLCPEGWHIPTDADWTILSDFLGGERTAGGFMKSTGNQWDSPNYNATNYAGFSGFPGGGSSSLLGSFTGQGSLAVWWTSTIDYSMEPDEGWIRIRKLWNINEKLWRDGFMTRGGAINFLSVRCIKD
jgi:uncharacterized protein (TIGR02145 family)